MMRDVRIFVVCINDTEEKNTMKPYLRPWRFDRQQIFGW